MDLDGVFRDAQLGEEVREWIRRSGAAATPRVRSVLERAGEIPAEPLARGRAELEAIIRLVGRPALLVVGNTFEPPRSEVWRERLEKARAALEAAIPAVGRVEVRNHPELEWVGTGWLVRPDVIATNRHVAEEFATRGDAGFTFKQNFLGRRITARVDFLEEHGQPAEAEFRVTEILHVEPEPGPDMAFLRIEVEGEGGVLARPIPLGGPAELDRDVATIGYPAWDGRRNDAGPMQEIFQGIFDVKRLQPGRLLEPQRDHLPHDCSTLGGNSGSAVIDLETGRACGLHFGGRYRHRNYAVPSARIEERLQDLRL